MTHLELSSSAESNTAADASLVDSLLGVVSTRRLSADGGHNATLTHALDATPYRALQYRRACSHVRMLVDTHTHLETSQTAQ